MSADKYLTLKIAIGDLELYTTPDMGFLGSFSVTPKIHSHPYYEIIAVVDGGVCISLLDNESLELNQGELCIIPPECYHSTYALSSSAKMLAIRFSYNRIDGEGHMYDDFSSSIEQICQPIIFDIPEDFTCLLLALRRELMEKDIAWDFMCQSLLQMLYIEIFRLVSKESDLQVAYMPNDSKQSRYYHIEMWFAENFSREVTEESLAREMALSKRQLSRVISDIYGTSFREKLIDVRLHRAAQLLEQSNLSAENIASAVGYRSFSGFYRAFVKCFDCTPLEYRKHNKGELKDEY